MRKNKYMKEVIKIISVVIIGTISLVFITYALVGFIDWIMSDPFDLVETQITTYVEPIEFQICRDKGGIPIKDAWDGRVKRCDIIN